MVGGDRSTHGNTHAVKTTGRYGFPYSRVTLSVAVVTTHRLLPSEVDVEQLSELLDDARAIPAAAFSLPTTTTRTALDLEAVPAQSKPGPIPASALSIVEAAEHHWADFSR
jgi:hypothetical protein